MPILVHPQKPNENNGNCAIRLAVGPKHSRAMSELIFEIFRDNSQNNKTREGETRRRCLRIVFTANPTIKRRLYRPRGYRSVSTLNGSYQTRLITPMAPGFGRGVTRRAIRRDIDISYAGWMKSSKVQQGDIIV